MIGKALKLIRQFHDLTGEQLANDMGVSRSTISSLESGAREPSMDMLRKYSEKFDIPVSNIMFFSENVEQGKKGENIRLFTAKKVTAILNFIAERSDPPEC